MELNDQVVFDAYKMIDSDFIEYYSLYYKIDKEDVCNELKSIKNKISKGKLEVVCYNNVKNQDIFYTKSCINKLRHELKKTS